MASGEKLSIEELSISVQASLSEFDNLSSKRETSRRNGAEGEEERRMFLRRLGYDLSKDTDESPQAKKTNMRVIKSAEMLLHRLIQGHFMCLIGPPASGKTVTMLQVACAAADAKQRRVDMGLLQDNLPPCIPIFLRAAELSTLFCSNGK